MIKKPLTLAIGFLGLEGRYHNPLLNYEETYAFALHP
jgi:hypothetical protein